MGSDLAGVVRRRSPKAHPLSGVGVDFRSDGHGLGDNPYSVKQFAAWLSSRNVAWANIFVHNGAAHEDYIIDGRFPNA
jgi:hypothetical protein